ncbi:hypothetical protein PLIIFM63780_001065 [Purpureocillium lilacinum]|uniref:uncharacterized protein n=1 Tax=Purpureocillium lilacinum TaxID=33203 RepID=UPI0020874F08|nr:hypothetical protein PLICBS_002794 [Purpureocillium lilacinum]GJN77573.1 hypothetical protein PLIIFM63780_001065 [Purpureocillium lilacinum]
MPRNESPANTVMRDVASGDESGVYHLLISSLPFGTKWQLFKDWIREADCDVDHIELFQKSTNGWIRLLGRDNFERALRHLRTNPFAGREIIVDERNRTEPIKILELIDDPPPKPKFGWRFQRSRRKGDLLADDAASVGSRAEIRQPPQQSESMAASTDVEASRQGRERGSIRASPIPGYPSGPVIQRMSLENAAAPMGYLSREPYKSSAELQGAAYLAAGDMPFSITPWNLPYGSAYAQSYRPFEAPPPVSPGLQAGLPSSTSSGSLFPQVLRPSYSRSSLSWASSVTETPTMAPKLESSIGASQRPTETWYKVQLLSLRNTASTQDVEKWVRNRLRDWESAIVRIDVPIDHQKGRIRGSAYITLSNAVAAGKAVEALQQQLFMGRLVYARRGVNYDTANKQKRESEKVNRLGQTKKSSYDSAEVAVDDQVSPAPQAQSRDVADKGKYAPPVIAHGTNYKPPK